jgi:hypothetical protein
MLNWTNVLIVNGAGVAAVSIIGAEYLVPIVLPPDLRTPAATQVTAGGMVAVEQATAPLLSATHSPELARRICLASRKP